MSRKIIDTVILDLDNTLFDWFAVWYASFSPVYDEIIRVSGKPVDEVEAGIRKVHQTHRTSEFTFLIEEVESLSDERAKGDVRELFKDALGRSRQGRDQNLKLYPSVFPSLWELKKKGTKIVAYTESMGFYSAYRLKRFGLDGVIDVLFSPEDHVVPAGVFSTLGQAFSAEQETKNAIEIWKQCVSVHQHFNDLEMRIRNFAITVVGALLAAVSFTYQQGLQTQLFGKTWPAGLGLAGAAFFAWVGFFLMDRYWYHVLLKGAVKHSAKIEERYASIIPEIGLGKTISDASQNVKILGMKLNSDRRLEGFYLLGGVLLALIFVFLLFAEPGTTLKPGEY